MYRNILENTTGWDDFVSSFSTHVPEWLKTGDVKTDFKKLLKCLHLEEEVINAYCSSDSVQKELTEDRLRQVFAAVGKELAK